MNDEIVASAKPNLNAVDAKLFLNRSKFKNYIAWGIVISIMNNYSLRRQITDPKRLSNFFYKFFNISAVTDCNAVHIKRVTK